MPYAASEVRYSEFSGETSGIEMVNLRYASSRQFSDAMEAAASDQDDKEEFIFTWIAIESLLGKGKDRKEWFEKLDEEYIHNEFERIRNVRAKILKSEGEEIMKSSDVTFLQATMKLFSTDDPGIRQVLIERLRDL